VPIEDAVDLSSFPPEERPRIAGMIRLWALLEVLRCSDCVIRDADGQEHRGTGAELLAKKDLLTPTIQFIQQKYLELREPTGST
jgi:hypothetical protein